MRRATGTLLLVLALGASASTPLDLLRGDVSSQGFASVTAPRTFDFPRDHGVHPEFRHEWWYLTGQLDGVRGEHFGFELTFFRFALAPPAAQPRSDSDSAWRTKQLYLAHFAVTDLERGTFHYAERDSREALGLAGAQFAPWRIWVEDWSIEDASPSTWALHAAAESYGLDLELRPLMAPVLNGEQGLSRKSGMAGAASYYYSIPRIAVRGKVLREGRALAVQGLAWLDREWGSGALAPDQQGWDWFAVQFKDGSSLMFYCLRRRDGSRDAYSAGTWVSPEGRVRPLANRDVQIEVGSHWSSPRGGRYPASWQLQVPALALDVTVRPLLANQELATSPRYWEGAVEVTGQRASAGVSGRGYVELVGYAGTE